MDPFLEFVLDNPVIILGVLIGGLIGFAFSGKAVKEILRIRRTPASVIGVLPSSGQFKVVGKAEGKTIMSRLTQKPCVFWQMEIKELRGSGDDAHYEMIYENSSHEPFELDDGTGRIQVFPAGAELILRNETGYSSGLLKPMLPQIEDTLNRQGIKTVGSLGFGNSLLVYERLIKSGQEIFALGEIKYEHGMRTMKTGLGMAMIISDKDEKGALSTLYFRILGNISVVAFVAGMLMVIIVLWSQ